MALYILEDKSLHPFLSKRTAQEITAVKALNQKRIPTKSITDISDLSVLLRDSHSVFLIPYGITPDTLKAIKFCNYNDIPVIAMHNIPDFAPEYIYSSTGITSPVYHANARYAANLRAFIETNGYDRVVCTHLYPMETLTAIRKSGDFTVPCYGVLTDYTCIPFLAETDLDGYFIAHEDLRAELVEKGIPSDRIIVTGIPVDEKFAHHMEKAAARNYLAIPQNQDVFLIMSGGIGVGNAGAICDEILRRHSGAFTVYILVGRNSDLKQTLEEKYAGNEHVRIVTFTKKVNVYMNAADVMISKPGGLTSTEAAVAQVPLVQLLVYTACEAPNIAFFSSHGLSERAENAADAAEKAVALVRDKARAEAMREAQRNTIAPNAADKIAERIVLS